MKAQVLNDELALHWHKRLPNKNSWPELPANALIVAVPLTLGDGLVSAIPASGTIRRATVTIRVHHAPASSERRRAGASTVI
eukprot:3952060-Pyramimonas_sp.AAC.1